MQHHESGLAYDPIKGNVDQIFNELVTSVRPGKRFRRTNYRGAKFKNDGYDEDRLNQATRRRQMRNAKRLRNMEVGGYGRR